MGWLGHAQQRACLDSGRHCQVGLVVMERSDAWDG
jgi:hypothetical protein